MIKLDLHYLVDEWMKKMNTYKNKECMPRWHTERARKRNVAETKNEMVTHLESHRNSTEEPPVLQLTPIWSNLSQRSEAYYGITCQYHG